MKTTLQIFKRDCKRLLRNPVAMLVVIGVCILPSLYAWFNIAANMDPYSNTKGIKVAIASNDTGACSDELSLNAGASLIEQLEKNDSLGWTFVDEDAAIEGVKSGKYYAAIVIPEDFSESLLSIISGKPQNPVLDYYVNEKKNAIAPKITDTGAGTIQQEINDTFSNVAAETISNLIIKSVSKVSGNMSDMNTETLRSISDIQKNLDDYQTTLKDFQETVKSSSSIIADTQAALDSVNTAALSGAKTLSSASDILNTSRSAIGTFSSTFSQSLSDGDQLLSNIYASASDKLGSIENDMQTINGNISNSLASAQNLVELNEEVINDLKVMTAHISNEELVAALNSKIADLESQNAKLQELVNSLKAGNDNITTALNGASTARTQLNTLVSQSKQSLRDYQNSLNQTLLPTLNQSLDTFSTLSGNLSATMNGISPSITQLKSILGQLDSSLKDSASVLDSTGTALQTVNDKLSSLTTDLKALESSSAYQQFLSLKGIDPDGISTFMSSPVTVDTEVLYDVKNYGSAMTPFYTNLALWVGGLILVSIFKQEVDFDEKIPNATATQCYFGRFLLFLIIGLIQSVIVCAGDIWLIKAQCNEPAAFIFAGMVCSVVYVSLIYAMALAFKHIGKALCVLLVILQIPGASGTYPIEMMPAFFQNLHPLLPFSYGISAMREAIAGMYAHNYRRNLLIMLVFLGIAFLIGLGLRPLLMNLNYLFDRRLAVTDLMLCETSSTERNTQQVSMIYKAMLYNEVTRKELTNKAEKFERTYSRRIRRGFNCIFILAFVFLILMFSLESKLVFLILWIVSVVVLAFYLIIMEYIHDKTQKQLELAKLSEDELLKLLKKGNERS